MGRSLRGQEHTNRLRRFKSGEDFEAKIERSTGFNGANWNRGWPAPLLSIAIQ